MTDRRVEKPITKARLNLLNLGSILLIIFMLSVFVLAIGLIVLLIKDGIKDVFRNYWSWLIAIIIIENIIFWLGIILVYITSTQLGLKMRIIGIVCGMMPIANLIVLVLIITIATNEYQFEKAKLRLDLSRVNEQICKTKYPLLMVHGVFFRDYKYFNYWGRVPEELIKNGATIYYGNHQSAASVENSSKELAARIREIVETTGCGKLNIIAHSKGGLDVKTAVAMQGVSEYVASITTINTPHLGCEFAEYLLTKAPEGLQEKVAAAYNAALRKMGDKNPDFIAAVTDLTAVRCKQIWGALSTFDYAAHGVYTQSVGSCMKHATSGAFPLNMSYLFVGRFDGPNDGLVGEPSFRWGKNYTYIENKKYRGISHGDMIDLNRENIPGFDVREFYVNLVSGLKARGL